MKPKLYLSPETKVEAHLARIVHSPPSSQYNRQLEGEGSVRRETQDPLEDFCGFDGEYASHCFSTHAQTICHAPPETLAGLTEPHEFDDTSSTGTTSQETIFPLSSTSCSFFDHLRHCIASFIPYGGLLSNCFSLGSVTLGGGIISMPYSFATSGIIMAIIYLMIFNLVTIYTMALLGFVMEKTQLHTWEETAKYLFGPGWDYFVGFVLWLSCFGTAIAYISGVSSLIDPILQDAPGTPDYLKTINGNRLITSMIWLVFMLPIIIPKHINSLRYVSAFGCAMVVYFVVVIIVHSSSNGLQKGMRGEMKLFTTGNEAIYGLSIFIFSYLCQAVSHSVYFEQKPKPSVKQLSVATGISMTVCMALYILAGVFGYFDFADDTKDSILFNYDPINQPYVMVAYVGMFIKICAAFAMNMIPCRNFTYHCLRWNLETVPYWKHAIAVISTAFAALLCGLFIPSVNLAFGLVGSLCGGFISFIFPALFWMYSGNWSLKTVGIWHWLATYLLLVAGVIAIVFGTIATIYSSFVDTA